MTFFVFRVTDACDKRCATCCVAREARTMAPDLFREKLDRIAAYCTPRAIPPLVFLTGGEPFLYRAEDRHGGRFTIVELAATVRDRVPGAHVVVKTSGWREHGLLDRRYIDTAQTLGAEGGEVRLGFNLFQEDRHDSEARLAHMLGLLLARQRAVRVETIYDRENIHDTFRVIEEVVSRLEVPHGVSLEPPDPEVPYWWEIPVRGLPGPERVILLSTMPAYAGLGRTTSDRCYEARFLAACPRLEAGPDHLSYEPDLSVRHCNDAFADHSVDPVPAGRFGSIAEELDFVRRGLARLRGHLAASGTVFASRREQCGTCTRFVHGQGGAAGMIR